MPNEAPLDPEDPHNEYNAQDMPDFEALAANDDPFRAWEREMGDGSRAETVLQADGEADDLPDTEREEAFGAFDAFARSGQEVVPENYDEFGPADLNMPTIYMRSLPPGIAAGYGLDYDSINVFATDATDTSPASTTVTAINRAYYEADTPFGPEPTEGEEMKYMSFSRDPLGVAMQSGAEAEFIGLATHAVRTEPTEGLTLAEARSIMAAVAQAGARMQEY